MKIVFMGTPEFSLNILQALIDSGHQVVGVVTQPDRKVGRKQIITPTPIKELALKHHIPVFQPEKIKEDYETVLSWEPDLIVTCAYGQFVPKVLLELPAYGAINVHASLLPKYRGGAPIHKAIIDGNTKTGITIMYMVPKMDAGDIISQKEMLISHKDNVQTLHDKLSQLGAELLILTLPSLFNKSNTRTPQDLSEVTYAYNIQPEQEKIDWYKAGESIYNQIRGLNPWPGAYTILDHKRIKIYEAEELGCIHNVAPGTIIEVLDDGIIISSGNETCVKVVEVQLEGKKRQTMKEIINGHHPFVIGKKFE